MDDGYLFQTPGSSPPQSPRPWGWTPPRSALKCLRVFVHPLSVGLRGATLSVAAHRFRQRQRPLPRNLYEDVLERGCVDVYLQRAGMAISKEFARHHSTFLKDIAESMPPGGVLATDDVWVGHFSDNGDNSARFPPGFAGVPIPWRGGTVRKGEDLLEGISSRGSRSRVEGVRQPSNVRFVPAGGFVAVLGPRLPDLLTNRRRITPSLAINYCRRHSSITISPFGR